MLKLLALNSKLAKTAQVKNLFFIQALNQSSSSKQTEPDFSVESNASNEGSSTDFMPNIPDAEEALEREERFRRYVERSRDVSRFSKKTAENKYRKVLPTFSDPESRLLNNQQYFRKIYSTFGKSSGIEAGVAWPHKQELQNMIQEEAEYDLSLEQKIKTLIERKTAEKDAYQKLYTIYLILPN